MPARLNDEEKLRAIEALQGWSLHYGRDALVRSFKFASFNAALGFMVRVGLIAERMGHHPEWFNIYDRVDVVLSTHDKGGLTRLDVDLAQAMDEITKEMGLLEKS